jgi:uncharacterized protein YjcR
MLIFSKYLFLPRFHALAIWPFIILKYKKLKEDEIIMNHERIHLKQQLELLWLFYFIWYFIEFLIHLIRTRNFMKAYNAISFEKEAYANEQNLNYLLDRKTWSFLKYF